MMRCGPVGGPYNNLQLPANPDQDIQQDIRVSTTQTLYGVYFDDYGLGIPMLTLSGDSAWSSPKGMYNGLPINGYQTVQHLYQDILQRYFQLEQNKSNPQDAELLIFDYTTNSAWSVKPVPPGMTLSRNKSSPMTYAYTLRLAIIRDLIKDPSSPDFAHNDPVKTLVVGTTSTPASSASINQAAMINNLAANAASKATPSTQSTPSAVSNAISGAKAVRQAPTRTYTVVSGDTLWAIAKYFYGDGSLWYLILNANSIIKNPNLIFPGQILTIPPGPNSNAA